MVEIAPSRADQLAHLQQQIAYGRHAISSDDVIALVGAAVAVLGTIEGLPDDPNLTVETTARLLRPTSESLRAILVRAGAIRA
jgi:hypothetical protein